MAPGLSGDFSLVDLSSGDTPITTSTASDKTSTNGKEEDSAKHPPSLPALCKNYRVRSLVNPFSKTDHLPSDIAFDYVSNCHYGKSDGDIEWVATLLVHSPDVLRLMREGFYWSSANIDPELSTISFDCSWQLPTLRPHPGNFGNTRRYMMTDRSEECRWTACLLVSFIKGNAEALSWFQPEHLTGDKLDRCRAFSDQGQIYYYDSTYPEWAVNVVYGDMPLEGRWPWPKKRKEQSAPTEKV